MNAENDSVLTHFASPQRASEDILSRQNSAISGMRMLCELLDSMPEFVMILNRFRQIIFGNKPLADLARSLGCISFIGMRPGELLSCQTAITAVSGCGTGEGCKTCGAVLTILDALNGTGSARDCRISRIASGGMSPMDLRVWGRPFVHENEGYCLIIATDISNETRRKILEKIFFHDVLNTAGNILNISDMLCSGAIQVDDVKEDLKISSQQLVEEIKAQKDLLSAENNELKVNPERLNSLKMLDEAIASFKQNPAAMGRNILRSDDSEDFGFECDPMLLRRVLVNLMKNASEASRKGEPVTLSCSRIGGRPVFRCHNCSFIPRDIQLQIFKRSFSTKGEGRGIGTYSVKLIVEKYLGGKADFESSHEKGTVFYVSLPAGGE